MDMLILSDSEGVVDMTHDAISRRLNVPIEKVTAHINELMKPDPTSRSKKLHGARLALLDSHRDWGWKIVNYAHYRAVRDEEGRRGYFRDYMRDRRAKSRKTKAADIGESVNARKPPVKKPSLTVTPVNNSKLLLTNAEAEEEAYRYPSGTSAGFQKLFQKWIQFRKGLGKKPKDWRAMFQEQLNWLEKQPMVNRDEIINQSIRNGWQGLFALTNKSGAKPDIVKKIDPVTVQVPERLKAWVAENYPDKREEAMKWQTYADVPAWLRLEWKKETLGT